MGYPGAAKSLCKSIEMGYTEISWDILGYPEISSDIQICSLGSV
jgi:hypothetical protein